MPGVPLPGVLFPLGSASFLPELMWGLLMQTGWMGIGVPQMVRSGRGGLRYWLGIGITLLSVALLWKGVDLNLVAEDLGSIDYLLAIVSLLTIVLTVLLKAFRWRILFQPPSAQPSAAKAVSILTIGQMINMVFPLRFGEVGRVYLTSEIEGTPPSLTAATIVIEKTIDTLMLLICVALLIPFAPLPDWLRQPVLVTTAVAVGAALLVFAVTQWRRGARAALGRVLGILPHRVAVYLTHHADIVLTSAAALRSPRILAQIALLSGVIWVLAAITNYTAFLTLKMATPFVAAVFLLVVLQVGVAIPSAPGRVGVFQALTVLGLSLYGVDPSIAISYGIFLYAVVFLPPSVAGIALLWYENSKICRRRSRATSHQISAPGGPT